MRRIMFKLAGIGAGIVLAGWFSSDAPKMPPEEAHFCNVLEAADEVYEPLRKQWYAENNGLAQDKIGNQLDQMVDARNVDILKILGTSKPHITGWTIQLTKIDTTDLAYNGVTTRYIEIAGKFPCKLPVTFTAVELPMTYANFLRNKKIDDYIAITATLVSHDAAMNPPQKAIEWSAFQGASMAEPEYRLSVQKMNDYTTE
jgi:hypothetical protein